jgi:hypothetical protein
MSPAELAMLRLSAAIARNGQLVNEILETIEACRERTRQLEPRREVQP